MRSAIRTFVPVFAFLGFAIVATPFLSGPASAQEKTTPPAADTPPAGASGATADVDTKELLAKGEAAMKAGDFAAAAAAFNSARQAAEQKPGVESLQDHAKALVGHGRALTALKEFDAAANDFKAVLSDYPTEPSALIGRAQMKLENNKPDEALDDFQKALKADPTNMEAQFGYGKCLVTLGHSDEAIAPLTKVITADPQNGEALRLRGTAYAGVFKNKQAVEDLQQAVQINPEDYEADFTLGLIAERSEDYPAAAEEFGKAIEHYKPKPGMEDVPYLQGHLHRAAAFIELGKATKEPAARKAAYQSSVDAAQKLIGQLDSKNPAHGQVLAAAMFARGIGERMLLDYGAAIRTLTRAIELNPDFSDAYFRRGICFQLIGEDKMAISDFQQAANLALNAGDRDPRSNLWEGFTYAKLGDYHQALRAYGNAIAASDRYTPAYYNRALTYMQLGDYNKAISDFNDAIRVDPTNADYYFKRGVAYQLLGNNQKASESFAAALDFDKNHAGAHRHMAEVMQALGRTELATQYRQKADQLAPTKKTQ